MPEHCCCRRAALRSSTASRVPHKAAGPALASIEVSRATLAALPPRAALRLQVLRALQLDDTAMSPDALATLAEAHGWALPAIARREGGLYALSASAVAQLRKDALLAGRGQQLTLPYHEASPLKALYHVAPRSSHTGMPTSVGALPTFDLDGGGILPAPAAQLLSSQMACVLRASGAFPAGVAKWCRPEYLESQLRLTCHVLIAPAHAKEFKYFTDLSKAQDRVMADYAFTPPVRSEYMEVGRFFRRSHSAASTECVYLQQTLLAPDATGQGLAPAGSLGEDLMADVSRSLNHRLLSAVAQAGRFGPPARAQLFLGTGAAANARTILHFDQYDNMFMQLAGRKTFILYDPLEGGHLYPFPVHHPLDRSAQAQAEGASPPHLPRASSAAGVRVTLEPGDVLVLPAYWWHEVITEPGAELTVSLNFWFNPMAQLLQPTLPLSPLLRCELARQLEFAISDAFGDRPTLVPAFCAALCSQLDAISAGSMKVTSSSLAMPSFWQPLVAHKPAEVEVGEWEGLFEYFAVKAIHLIGAQQVAPFVRDRLDPERFARLKRRASARPPRPRS